MAVERPRAIAPAFLPRHILLQNLQAWWGAISLYPRRQSTDSAQQIPLQALLTLLQARSKHAAPALKLGLLLKSTSLVLLLPEPMAGLRHPPRVPAGM